MEQRFLQYLNEFSNKLFEAHGFQKKKEERDEEKSHMVEYGSDIFSIKLEQYFREIYVLLYRTDKSDYEINLFNLLEYLKQGSAEVPRSEYFHKEKDVEECYKLQLGHISSVINENYDLINDFFSADNYESRISEFEKYWKSKHPEFYKP